MQINFLYSSSCYPPDTEKQQLIGCKKTNQFFLDILCYVIFKERGSFPLEVLKTSTYTVNICVCVLSLCVCVCLCVCMCLPTHRDSISVFIQCRASCCVHLSCLYHACHAHHRPILCSVLCVFSFYTSYPLTALSGKAMWTAYKRDGVRLGKDGCNMCSVMCAVIDMLTSSFQAAASKPRLAAPIGFSSVSGCLR